MVYRIAKEIQLLKPNQFNNAFLGVGGFHMERRLCWPVLVHTVPETHWKFCGSSLAECFGTDVIKTVISGSQYSMPTPLIQ